MSSHFAENWKLNKWQTLQIRYFDVLHSTVDDITQFEKKLFVTEIISNFISIFNEPEKGDALSSNRFVFHFINHRIRQASSAHLSDKYEKNWIENNNNDREFNCTKNAVWILFVDSVYKRCTRIAISIY